MKPLALGLAFVSLVAFHLTACSSGDSTGAGGAGGEGEGSTAEGAGPGATTGPSGPSGATTGPTGATTGSGATTGPTSSASSGGGNDCTATGTYEACDDCECTKNQAGCDAYYVIEDDKCLCGAMAPCATACAASYCMGMDRDAACLACEDMLDDTCYDATAAECANDPACKAYYDASSASCDSLNM